MNGTYGTYGECHHHLRTSESGSSVYDTTSTKDSPRAGRREWIGLAVLALPTLLVSIDVFVMLLAVPRLSDALGADSTQQLWIMDIYGR
jgi:hypothetical protein